MGKRIVIDPVTRIEGHSKITLQLDDNGVVEDAKFHVTQFRGFEKFCQGRPFYEMPSLLARTCGICPVSHLVAGAKACDDLFSVQIPKTAIMLRRIINLAQIMQSHALNFFYLSAPDLLLGMDAERDDRNIFGVYAENPQLAKDGIRLRQIGQSIIERLGGKRIHPTWVVPGGVNSPLSKEHHDEILALMPETIDLARKTLDWYKERMGEFTEEISTFGNFPSHFLGLVDRHGNLEHYDGTLRVMDASGNIVVDGHNTLKYGELIGEAVEPWTYMKFPYLKSIGYPKGMYRVGPLARLNIIDRCGTEYADRELRDFRGGESLSEFGGGAEKPQLSSFHYHWARLIEILFAGERIQQILSEPDVLSDHVRAHAEPNSFDGIGVTEAPRGTLMHHYKIDRQGIVTWADFIIATGHNNLAMNRGIQQVAKDYVHGENLKTGMLNRVEAVIRAFDPCLSCSTHAVGQMKLHVELVDPEGNVLDEQKR